MERLIFVLKQDAQAFEKSLENVSRYLSYKLKRQIKPEQVLQAFKDEAITIFAGSPTLFTGLINYPG